MKIQHLTINNELTQSPIFKEFYEEAQRCNRVIAQARQQLLTEEKLSAQQIDQIFKLVADEAAAGKNTDTGAVDTGSNKTALGKVTGTVGDALSKLKSKWESLKDWVSKSGPVQGFDVAFDQLQGSLLNAMGGEGGKVASAMQKYRQFAVKHPVAQGLILVALAAMVGTAAGGGTAALAGVTFGIRTLDALLKGNKFSTATYKGAKAAAIMTVASLGIKGIMDNFDPDVPPGPGPTPGPTPGPDVNPDLNPDDLPPVDNPDIPLPDVNVIDYTIKQGDTLSQLAKDNGISVQDIMDANPNITNPNGMLDTGKLIQPGDAIKIPSPTEGITSPDIYSGGTGTLKDTIQKMMSGEYTGDANIALNALKNDPSQLRLLSPEQAAWAKTQITKLAESARRAQWIDRDATIRSWALNESLGRTRGGVILTEVGVNEIFRRVDEGIWDSIKKGAGAVTGAVGSAAKKGFSAATNKITYDSLGMEWRAINPNRLMSKTAGMTADSEFIEVFLRRRGVKDPVIVSVFKQMGIPVSTVSNKDQAALSTDDATDTAATAEPATSTTAEPATSTTATAKPNYGKSFGAGASTPTTATAKPATSTTAEPATPTTATAKPNYGKSFGAGASTPTTATSTTTATGSDTFGRMINQLQPPQQSSTGGTTTQTATGTRHVANPNNPNLNPQAVPAAVVPVTGAPGVRGAPKTRAKKPVVKQTATNEQRRTYGGKYVRESAAQQAAREFENYLLKF
jgi:hypothetical protein